MTTDYINSFEPDLLNLGPMSSDLWWVLYGAFFVIGLVFWLVMIYHWLRYESQKSFSISVIAVNGLVIALLLGGAATNLATFLN